MTLSREHIEAVKSVLVRAIEEVRSTVQGSAEEDPYCYSLDFYSLKEEG